MEILGLRGKEGVVLFAQGEKGGAKPNPSLAPLPSPPPPGLFPRKLYQCGHARRRHLGQLVSRCRGEEAGFSCVAAGRRGTNGSPAPPLACGSPGRLSAAPQGAWSAPMNRLVSAPGSHSITSEKPPLPLHTHPFLFCVSTH